MQVELRDLSKKEANLSILGGDIAVLYIIQDKLLRNPTTEFAGVITRHPLTNDLWMRVVSSKPTKRHHQGSRHRNQRSYRIKKAVSLQDKGKLNGILPKM